MAHVRKDKEKNNMSEDNTQKNVSEETIASIVDDANEIAKNSDEIRENMVAIVKALQPAIQRAGIRFGGSAHWNDGDTVEPRTFRIATVKTGKSWGLEVEYSDARAEEWNGHNWIGWANQFSHEAVETGMCGSVEVKSAARYHVKHFIELLPAFLDEYCAALQRRHQEYSDLRKKAEQIRAIVED